ncbi:MAG: hypothetical protein IJT27_00995 [Clostridia bacterium]|nr:hypothetical protein [Clostridia bacterium]
MKKINEKTIGKLLIAAGILFCVIVLAASFLAIRNLRADYLNLTQLDLSEDTSATISYDDRLYASMGAGIEIDHNDNDNESRLADFIENSLRSVDTRILSCGILYVMMFVTVFAFPLYIKFGRNRKKHVLITAGCVFLSYAFFLAAVYLMFLAFRIPFYFPQRIQWLLIAVALTAVTGGSCFLAWLLRMIRYKKITAVLAIPLVFLLFILSASFEGQLFSPQTVDSFAFVADMEEGVFDEDYEGEVYYDSEKNVLVLNGKEYEPEQIENPDSLHGAGRIGAYAFELLDPYSGNGLFLIYEAAEITVEPIFLILYTLKALAWIILPLCIQRKRKAPQTSPAET